MSFTGSPTFTIPLLAVDISFYRLFLILALCVTVAAAIWSVKKSGLDFKRASWTLAAAALTFFVGARLFNIIIRPELYLEQPWRLWSLDASGFSLYGGILLAAVSVILLSSRGSKPKPKQSIDCHAQTVDGVIRDDNFIWKFGDAVAPAFGLGLAVMRVGCFLNGCCFGRPTNLPWGIEYPLFSDAHFWQLSRGLTDAFTVLPVHPTQLYELAYSFAGAVLAYWLWRKKLTPGTAILSFALWLTVFRLLNHFLRAFPYATSVTDCLYPAFYLALIAACGWLLYRKLAK